MSAIVKRKDGKFTDIQGNLLEQVRPGVFRLADGREITRGKINDFVWCADKAKPPGITKQPKTMDLQGRVIGYHVRKDDDGNIIKQKVMDEDNLVVRGGRLWALHKLFNYPTSTISGYMPYWFGMGEGGATTDNTQNPLYPQDADTNLYSPVVFDAAQPAYADSGYKKPLTPGVFFITENVFSIIYTIVIPFAEGNGSGTTSLNELAMYLSPSQDVTETTFNLMSHVTMGSRPKTINDQYEFEWWIYL